MPAPPPLPPGAQKRRPSSETRAVPQPSREGYLTTMQKMSLADIALALRDEQLDARIIHYKAELQTNAELDAITAQVVAELRAMQGVNSTKRAAEILADTDEDRTEREIELIRGLKTMLARLFKDGEVSPFLQRQLGEISKRFARYFFESELHDRLRGADTGSKTCRSKEQLLYYLFAREQIELGNKIDTFEVSKPEIKDGAREILAAYVRELQHDFLSRSTPELNRLVKILNEVLGQFFSRDLPPSLGELAWEVVKEAKLADQKLRAGYKISSELFPSFRKAFERRLLQRLVVMVEEGMLKRVRESQDPFREETLRFVADPQIFGDICGIVCNAVYDFLYLDGFLDLPEDWRATVAVDPVTT